jgi:DNA processing protein
VTGAPACSECMRRAWLLGRLAGHLDVVRAHLDEVLALTDGELIAAVGGAQREAVEAEFRAFAPGAYLDQCAAAEVAVVCRCHGAYPSALCDLPAAPAALHVAGSADRLRELLDGPAAAVVGARRASPYALETTRRLARDAARAGVTIVSGMARGVDAAAHDGALQAGGRTMAVLAAAPQKPYPASSRPLHRRILRTGVVVSELGPGVAVRRWMFPARNRLIAALSGLTIVVAARRGSGAMLTAERAQGLGRQVGAVPGPAGAPLSWGPHALLRRGARLVTGGDDILDALARGDARCSVAPHPVADARMRALLDALADGFDTPAAFGEAGLDARQGLAALAELELAGHISRRAGGTFSIAS